MNVLLIIVLILLLCNIVVGYKRGIVKQIISLVSLIVLCIVAALIGSGFQNYLKGEFLNVVVMVLLLSVLGVVNHLLGIVFFSAKLISKLPVVHWVDKLLGSVFGVFKSIFILWTVYTFVMMLDMGTIGQQILMYTQQNEILSWFYEHNYIAAFIQQIRPQLEFLL